MSALKPFQFDHGPSDPSHSCEVTESHNHEITCDNRGTESLDTFDLVLSHNQQSTGPENTLFERVKKKLLNHHLISVKFLLNNDQSSDALMESLAVTGNFKILKEEFEVKKADIESDFQPTNPDHTVKISSWRKKLYLVAEGLTPDESIDLVKRISGQKEAINFGQLEDYFDRWIQQKKSFTESKIKGILLDMGKLGLAKLMAESVTFHHGLCVIINQKLYTKGHHEPRFGTDLDRERLRETFTRIGFDVFVVNNIKHSRLKEAMEDIRRTEIKESHKCIVVCVLAHGQEDEFFCVDDNNLQGYPLKSLIDIFNVESSRHLAKMPKIFFIQACQGNITLTNEDPSKSYKVPEVSKDGPAASSSSKAADHYRNQYVCQSAVSGTTSLRHQKKGAFFVRAVCSAIMMKNPCDIDSLHREILQIVNRTLEIDGAGESSMVPTASTTLAERVLFQVDPIKHKEAVYLRLRRVLVSQYVKQIVEKMISRELASHASSV